MKLALSFERNRYWLRCYRSLRTSWLLHETDEDINKKAKSNLCNGMSIILCGEAEHEAGKAAEFVRLKFQLLLLDWLQNKSLQQLSHEPIWAISTGDITGWPCKNNTEVNWRFNATRNPRSGCQYVFNGENSWHNVVDHGIMIFLRRPRNSH